MLKKAIVDAQSLLFFMREGSMVKKVIFAFAGQQRLFLGAQFVF
jgi:hypothetical protein